MNEKTILAAFLTITALFLWSRRGQEFVQNAIETPAARGLFDPIFEAFMTRGERNNNPGNIERNPGTRWQGMSADQSKDERFAVFDSPEYGIRALGKLLKNYHTQGFNTLESILHRYAPGSENDTVSYIQHVSHLTGFTPDQSLELHDPAQLHSLISAIITHENGRNIYTQEQINAGISMIG